MILAALSRPWMRPAVSVGGGGSPGDWYDTLITDIADMATAMSSASDGDIIGLEGADIGDYNPFIDSGNGGTLTYGASTGYDGAPGVTLVPPDTELVGLGNNAGHCCILGGENQNGTKQVRQINIGYFVYFGAGWATANRTNGPKWIDLWCAASASGSVADGGRPMVFIGGSTIAPAGHNTVGVTTDTAQMYVYPFDPDLFQPQGAGTDAVYVGGSPNIAGSGTSGTPVFGGEWAYLEHEIDYTSTRGNAEGMNRLHIWVESQKLAVVETPLARGESFPFDSTNTFWRGMRGLGFYWNGGVTRTANDHCIYSHIRYSPNMAVNSTMGPPFGFGS